MNFRPLADELRPATLADIVGQRHILSEGGLLRRVIESGKVPNMIFYGPSGTGKTTVANVIAAQSGRAMHRLNATTASLSDIKDIAAQIDTLLAPNGILLYLDEIQYFNKKQQQSLLEFIENGSITLIASTTENPFFYIYNAVLSRCSVFEFKQITPDDVLQALKRAVRYLEKRDNVTVTAEDGVLERLAESCNGDVRKALNSLELIYSSASRKTFEGKPLTEVSLSLDDAVTASSGSANKYDKGGDEMYDLASALMKSLRGSDPDASLHYLARFLDVGDIITPSRRILCSASEDIGLADPRALQVAVAAVQAAERVGLPEARLHLAEAVIFLATCPKSNSVVSAIDHAMDDVKAGKSGQVPRELQNVHADGTGFERDQGYLYPHQFPNHWVPQQYMPDTLLGTKYYQYGDNKNEQAAERYWNTIKGESEK